ncbi:hypothetical protein EYF80_033096 [Liparis tanakae]|uniref:Uncharacterized protein n=1 Tax=Liparis tanakae TaxID=230148 RepID=A0A4Z2GTE5_9TELE|nr:hypothetical protein EYF80_033096 [Liparis tanakae]
MKSGREGGIAVEEEERGMKIVPVVDGGLGGTRPLLGRAAQCQAVLRSVPDAPELPHLAQVGVALAASLQAQAVQQLLLSSLQQLVEDVEVSLSVVLMHDSGLLQQVVEDVSPDRVPLPEGTEPKRTEPVSPAAGRGVTQEVPQTSRTGLDMRILSLTLWSREVLGQLTA